MFKNATIFRMADGWLPGHDELVAGLSKRRFRNVTTYEREFQGFDVVDEANPLVRTHGSNHLISLRVEEKVLPAAAVKSRLKKRVAEIEKVQGFKPGRKQIADLKDEIERDMLSKAFTREYSVDAWLDVENRWFVIGANGGKADRVIEALKEALGELPLTLLRTTESPLSRMTDWVTECEAPQGFTVGRGGEINVPEAKGSAVSYKKHSLDGEDVKLHIGQGKVVVKVELDWREDIEFVLTQNMELRRLKFMDKMEEHFSEEEIIDPFVQMTLALPGLLDDLVRALGGEADA